MIVKRLDLSNQKVVVVGASSGIGLAVARKTAINNGFMTGTGITLDGGVT